MSEVGQSDQLVQSGIRLFFSHTLLPFQVCVGVQELLANPNPLSPAHSEAYVAFTSDRAAYDKRIRDQTKIYPPKT